MSGEAFFALVVVVGALVLLVGTRLGPDLVLLGSLVVLLLGGVLETEQALAGFASEALIAVAALFVVVAGLRETGVIAYIAQRGLGRTQRVAAAQARIMGPVAVLSAFVNNTPLVAIFMPAIDEWAKKQGISASKLMIPLSYATILGGMCTLVGTSTNLVVKGLLAEEGIELGMFDPAWIGGPCALVGILFVLATSRWLLPERRAAISIRDDPREYTVEMLVEKGGPLVGRTIEEAGLRHLPGMYLMEIDRDEQVLVAVSSLEHLKAGDRLVFVGVVESVVDLQKIRGLVPATDQVFKLDAPRRTRCLIEAVVSDTCPLVDTTIREGRFRSVYNAAVIAVARNGERLHQKIGDIVLRPGDTLLLEAHPSFADQQRNSRDFFLVSRIEDSSPTRHERAWAALAIAGGMVAAVSLGWLSMLKASLLAAVFMLLARCCSRAAARQSMDWQVLIVIAASLGLGKALEVSGAAAALAGWLVGAVGEHPWLALCLVYGITTLTTELITNNAAAVLVFPVAVATAASLQVSVVPFAMAVMIGASASFATPIGYQTNLMVYGPGGYRFGDYLRIGLPLNLMVWACTVVLAPLIWPF